eukprot:2689042-Pyramimonas_sp.AAC.1
MVAAHGAEGGGGIPVGFCFFPELRQARWTPARSSGERLRALARLLPPGSNMSDALCLTPHAPSIGVGSGTFAWSNFWRSWSRSG